MSVMLNIHKTHRVYTDDQDAISVEGSTVGQCLDHVVQRFPDMKSALFDEKGKLRNHIEIYVNAESAYPDELKKPVKDGDEIFITVMLAGG
ncbi:MAG: MoaD/ThiS family protein [Desulfovermiculus sp.]|nr:MoaD/ThiS family protein [Desulfovermiculus sp.]